MELLNHTLGHRSTISLMAIDTANVCQYIELRIDTDPFCTSCQIYSIRKEAKYQNALKPQLPLKWVFMEIIPGTTPKRLTNTFSNHLLIVDAY